MKLIDLFRKPIIGLMLRVFMSIIQRALSVIIKKNGSILIAAPQGVRFSDNPKYLFDYLISHGIDCCYMVNELEIFNRLQKEHPGKIIYTYSFMALITFIKASILINSYADWDFYPFQKSFSKRNINLWHGIALKKIGLKTNLSKIHKIKLKLEVSKTQAFAVSSELEGQSLLDCFGLKPEQILLSGTPRNDYLINAKADSRLTESHPELKKKTILYCPTFRNNGVTNILPFKDFSMKKLDNYLDEHNMSLLIRKHHREWYYSQAMGYEELLGCKNIFKAGQSEFEEIQELLPHIDILMTDYSGVYFDFLLLDRPIIFAPYDLEEYSSYPGLLYDYHEHTPGIKVHNTQEFMIELTSIFNGIDNYKQERKKLRDQFHFHQDGKASERILNYIQSLK